MTPYLEKAMNRVPSTLKVGVSNFFCGPESFTTDLGPLIGEVPELKNYFVAAGLNSIGILTGGGVGQCVANWIINGKPDIDVTQINVDRMHDYQANSYYILKRVEESLGMVYRCHYPTYSMKAARGLKKSAIYERMKTSNAFFRDVSGWEIPDWFAPFGVKPEQVNLSFNKENWFYYWEAEHKACRNTVICMDMSFMSKFLVQGKDAGEYLNWLCTANVNLSTNKIIYTQWLNTNGNLEGDVTVIKNNEYQFLVIVTDTMHRHSEIWLKNNIPKTKDIIVTDVTSSYVQFNIQGPKSRELIQTLTKIDLSNEVFPFRTSKQIDLGYSTIICNRITYVGELGYELIVPSEMILHVYDTIIEVGEKYGLVHAGLKALSSLRLEKAYRDYGHDIDNTDTILECGLGFTCNFEKKNGFLGKDKVVHQKKKRKLNKRLVQILCLNPDIMLFHSEILFRNEIPQGEVRAASYGHTLGGAVGLVMLKSSKNEMITKKYIDEAVWKIQVSGKKYTCKVSLTSMYDPKNVRIKY